MARPSIPDRGSRVLVHAFIRDVLDSGAVQVEDGAPQDWRSIRVEDGHGLTFTLSGDRSSLRVTVARILSQLDPDPSPDPPEVVRERHDEGGEAA